MEFTNRSPRSASPPYGLAALEIRKRVEVSVDGGKKWATARLTSPALQHAWRSWDFDWRPTAGEHAVMVRATDSQGRTQPMDRDKDRRSYEINDVVPTTVVVRASD